MQLEFTFRDVCNFIKKDEPSLITAVDNLLGLILVCSPLMVGPQGLMLLPLITAKNELIKLGKSIYDKFVTKDDADFMARQKRMEAAYALICYLAFFEALDQQLPEILRKKLSSFNLGDSSSQNIEELCRISESSSEAAEAPDSNRHVTLRIQFPHPTESLSQQGQRHLRLYQQLTEGFSEGAKRLPVWSELSEAERIRFSELLLTIPAAAVQRFESMYFELSRRYEDFAIWANLQEHKNTKEIIGSLSEYVQRHAELAKKGNTAIDIGFAKLHQAVLTIPEALKLAQASEIVEGLTRHYAARMNEPIIEDKEDTDNERPKLTFPKVCDAFIPQSFLVLRQVTKSRRLEDEETWKGLTRRNDLGAFLLSYLSSPYSTEAPLLILGHPGSGKSLLTTVLAAQLMSKHYTPVKVPLRGVDSDAGIVSQIEEQISRITNTRSDPWAKLSGAFKNNPPLLILDGFDELLQASGKVFSGYLRDVQNFQRSEAEQERPVRVIVTSRITLIDKATIPQGATVIRLLEFDRRQRDRWISIWNKSNKDYFEQVSIQSFDLPEDSVDAAKILALAEQPLLLLMLALYDSEKNQLRNSKTLDRTVLYESLLRRFVLREREKEPKFDDLRKSEKEKALEFDMQRLGVAAIGMYNRRKLHILSSELNEDLKFFNLERAVSVDVGRPLSEADLLLGSFFFVHKSKAVHKTAEQGQAEEALAFEFLHNTFGEFLTADFIIRQALAEVESLMAFKQNEVLRTQLEQKFGGADGFSRAWFACLVYTPLYTRPVVLEMIREWIGHILKRKGISQVNFLSQMDEIVLNQTARILSKREMPSIMQKEVVQEGYRARFGFHPLLGHIAIYSVNLILLRAIVSTEPFIFDESLIGSHEDGTRPWDQLTHIWRSWFSIDNLNGITAVLQASRDKSSVTLQSKQTFRVSESSNRLQTFLNINIALSDNISGGLAGLLLYEPSAPRIQLPEISNRLTAENIDLRERIALEQLSTSELRFDPDHPEEFFETAIRVVETMLHNPSNRDWDRVFMYISRGLKRRLLGIPNRNRRFSYLMERTNDLLQRVLHPKILVRVAEQNPYAIPELIRIWREFGGEVWMRHTGTDFIEWLLHPSRLREIAGDNSWIAVDWIELIRAIRGTGWLRRYPDAFFERILYPPHFRDLADQNPVMALGLLEAIQEAGGERFLDHFGQEIIEQSFDPDRLAKVVDRNPAWGLRWSQLLYKVAGEDWLQRYGRELFGHVLHPKRLEELAMWSPQNVLGWLQLAREADGSKWLRRYSGRVFEILLHPRQISALADSTPEEAVSLLQLAEEVMGAEWLMHFRADAISDLISPLFLRQLLARSPKAFIDAMALVRTFKPEKRADTLMKALQPLLHEQSDAQMLLKTLPIAALPELRWLAEATGNSLLHAAITEAVGQDQVNSAQH